VTEASKRRGGTREEIARRRGSTRWTHLRSGAKKLGLVSSKPAKETASTVDLNDTGSKEKEWGGALKGLGYSMKVINESVNA